MNIDATVTNGYTWDNWTKGSGNDPASTTTKATTVTLTQNTTLTANAADVTKPTVTLTSTNTLKQATQT